MPRRINILVLALIVACTVTGLAPQPARADVVAGTPAARAADWLLSEADGGVLPRGDGSADWQLTSDAVLGLIAAGASTEQLGPLLTSLERAVGEGRYGVLRAGEGQEALIDGGALAKLAVIVRSTGGDPHSFAGLDLLAEVAAALESGRVGNQSVPGNTFAQAYVVMALVGGRQDAAPAIDVLLQQQCPGGDFRLGLGTGPCTSGADDADRDVTALAIRALRAAVAAGFAVRAPLDRAAEWLVEDQAADGSWVGSPATDVANSNTTGLAADALAELRPVSAARAAGFVHSLQVVGGGDDGAVAYTPEALAAGPGSERYQWHRATAQALFALALWDVHTVAGSHSLHGRQWRTECLPEDGGFTCRTDIWALTVRVEGDGFIASPAWTFNNSVRLG